MKKVLLVLVAAGLLMPVRPAAACSCALRSARQNLDAAGAVFSGEAVTIASEDEGSVVALFDVRAVYKGEIGRTVPIRTGGDDAGCGLPFQTGVFYVVFAAPDGEEWTAGLCGGTTEDRTVLEREGIKPLRVYETGSRPSPVMPTETNEAGELPPATPAASARGGPIAIAWLALASAATLLLRARTRRHAGIGDAGT